MQSGVYEVCGRYGRPSSEKIFLLLFLLLTVASGDALAVEKPSGRFTVAQGEVICKRPGAGNARTVRPGDAVFVGDLIETGKDSRGQVVLTDDSVITLSPRSAVRVDQFAFDAATDRRAAVVNVVGGRARVIVFKERNRESGFKVVTSNAIASFSLADIVVVAEAAGTSLAVLDGRVSVKNRWYLAVGEVRLADNQMTYVKGKDSPTVPAVITEKQRRMYIKDVN